MIAPCLPMVVACAPEGISISMGRCRKRAARKRPLPRSEMTAWG
jgi:hypothetical protein